MQTHARYDVNDVNCVAMCLKDVSAQVEHIQLKQKKHNTKLNPTSNPELRVWCVRSFTDMIAY